MSKLEILHSWANGYRRLAYRDDDLFQAEYRVDHEGVTEWYPVGPREFLTLKEIARLARRVKRLEGAGQEVWDSIPATYDENDPTVQRHAQALADLRAALAEEEE